MDCFVFPNDETNGELIHYNQKKAVDFRGVIETGLFTTLDSLLDRIQTGTKSSTTKMVIGRLKDEKKIFFNLEAFETYLPNTTEAEIWRLINSIYQKRLKETNERK